MSCSEEVATTSYHPGGTATAALGTTCSRVRESGTDESGKGRWSYHILQGKHGIKVVTGSVYRPNKSQGFTTNYQQLTRLSRAEGASNPEPRDELLQDLKKQVTKWKDEIMT